MSDKINHEKGKDWALTLLSLCKTCNDKICERKRGFCLTETEKDLAAAYLDLLSKAESFEVEGCFGCPLRNDTQSGFCNINPDDKDATNMWSQSLPDRCPLRDGPATVKLKGD